MSAQDPFHRVIAAKRAGAKRPAAKDITAKLAKVTKAALDEMERELAQMPAPKRKALEGMPFGVALSLAPDRRKRADVSPWSKAAARAERAIRALEQAGVDPIGVDIANGYTSDPGVHVRIHVSDARAARLLVFDADAMPALQPQGSLYGFPLFGCFVFEAGRR